MRDDLKDGRVVVVGASLAGLRAAEGLRDQGFTGSLTVVGDEPHPPYDRPPLSKQVLLGQATADTTGLPMRRDPGPIRRALVSVYDKTGLEDLARGLHEAGVELVS
ncbi:FAD-dependent oxidoreductase, partial [Streptomyces sp. NPDC048279]|uniref:FAD-dependent oxidoreductase n=1 Tax=Streptomyces sp. NPDC048279 TaxID=3154714 RepID=UPI0034267293